MNPVLQPPKKQCHHQLHQQNQETTTSSRMATRGEIVEAQGGHIIRSMGRKDRHSKVCTAKGPRDRRVRLSAHTAIQFYDVQDRLGFDRPSKAVDWLIKNAKSAIDDLAKLPPWDPNNSLNPNHQMNYENENDNDDPAGVHRSETATPAGSGGGVLEQLGENPTSDGSGFLDADISDTIKSLFPMGATSSSVQFQSYPPDLVSRSGSSGSGQKQDLRLSLQSFQDPILLHQAQTQTHHLHQHHHHHQNKQVFSATTPLGFDGDSYPEEHGRLHRMVAWNNAGAADTGHGGGGGGGFIFNSPSPMSTQLGQSQYFSQRGPLQSSNTPSIRAWIDPSSITDHHHHHYLPPTFFHHQSAISGASGFRIPAQIQGEEGEHDGVSDKPSSAFSDSRH